MTEVMTAETILVVIEVFPRVALFLYTFLFFSERKAQIPLLELWNVKRHLFYTILVFFE